MTKSHKRTIEQSATRLRAIYGTLGPVLATLMDLEVANAAEASAARAAVLAALDKLDRLTHEVANA